MKTGQHCLLSTLLLMGVPVDEKLGIMKSEYSIPVDDKLKKDVSVMCNLSQGIEEKGIAIGEARTFLLKIGYTSPKKYCSIHTVLKHFCFSHRVEK